jgi:hypothetical protein
MAAGRAPFQSLGRKAPCTARQTAGIAVDGQLAGTLQLRGGDLPP